MEEFIRKHTEKILEFKKSTFKQKNAHEFVEKLVKRSIQDMERELTKCLLSSSVKADNIRQERKCYIDNFLIEFKELKKTLEEAERKPSPEQTKPTEVKDNHSPNKNIINLHWNEKMRVKDYEKEFPSFEQEELIHRKKNYVTLDQHYHHKMIPGNHECFCMSSKHPLVGICLNCGRIHCLQEGDKVCINCGNKLLSKNEYLNNIIYDNAAKSANNHKDKLLSFQKNFYSKLQIIDDFTDWYEVANNTWLDEKSRNIAKKEDDKIKYEFTNDE